MRFSEFYRLRKTQGQLDFVDIRLESDLPLYLDPYALTTRDDEWSSRCHASLVSFFGAVLNCVRINDRRRGAALLSRLTEPEETRLGVSKGHSQGRGIGEQQAAEVFAAMAKSAAARTGLLEDLADFALFVPGIGRDKISDMTTNIIRSELIKYTQAQCRLHGVPMREVSSGFCWDVDRENWYQGYVKLPVHDDKKILLVPKSQFGTKSALMRAYIGATSFLST